MMIDQNPLTALVGYQWSDSDSAELLHEELAMRGLTVIHDRCTFTLGTPIATAMRDAVDTCNAYVPFLTPRSLYENAPPGSPRPALDDEFIPICRRRRLNSSISNRPNPVIAAITHGLGEPFTEAADRVRKATGEDIASLWSGAIDQSGDRLTQHDAAETSRSVVDALLPPGDRVDEEPIQILVATRGTGQAARFLTIDATPSLGGSDRRPGTEQDWWRYLNGLRDLESTLSRWTPTREIDIDLRGHMTAAVAFGRVFNQAAGWRLTIRTRTGTTQNGRPELPSLLRYGTDIYRRGGPLVVDIDLIGHNVSDLATDAARSLPAPSGRVTVGALDNASYRDLEDEEIGSAATAIAAMVRAAAARSRPTSVELFVSGPAAFAGLLGSQLTALRCDLNLHELDRDRYVHALAIPQSVG